MSEYGRTLPKGVFLLYALGMALGAQERQTDNNLHGWITYEGSHPLGETRWRLYLEGNWRRHDAYSKWQQLLLRPGISYALTPKLTATVGYAFIETWPYGLLPSGTRFPEHRIWEQLMGNYRSGKVSWMTRGRFENRWLGLPEGRWRYENRLRLMQRMSVPLSSRNYLAFFDEFWIFVKPYQSSSAFDQNRAYAAIGWNLGRDWRLETGYMHQALLRRSGRILESNHTIRITLFSNAMIGK